MRPTRRSGAQSERGFALWEMMVLLAVLALFLAGVIVLTSKGIESLQPKNADRQLSAQGALLMDRLEALTREADVIYVTPINYLSTILVQKEELIFAADLDGDAPRSAVDAFVKGGSDDAAVASIENVSVTQPDNAGTELEVRVSDGDSGDNEVVLTTILDAWRRPAFQVEYEAGKKRNLNKANLATAWPDLRVTGLHIFLKIEDRGKRLEIDRAFKLKNPAPVRTAPRKDKYTGLP